MAEMSSGVLDSDTCENVDSERTPYIEREDYFMKMALISAKYSHDPRTKVGACIVNDDKKIVGMGYNDMPRRCDRFPWNKTPNKSLDSKFYYVCHGGLNAVLSKTSSNVRGCTIYTTLFPCNECAKVIIQSGIKEVVYLSDEKAEKKKTKAAKKMFEAAGINCRLYTPSREKIEIDFNNIPCDDSE